jgi:hypothetical protein
MIPAMGKGIAQQGKAQTAALVAGISPADN